MPSAGFLPGLQKTAAAPGPCRASPGAAKHERGCYTPMQNPPVAASWGMFFGTAGDERWQTVTCAVRDFTAQRAGAFSVILLEFESRRSGKKGVLSNML